MEAMLPVAAPWHCEFIATACGEACVALRHVVRGGYPAQSERGGHHGTVSLLPRSRASRAASRPTWEAAPGGERQGAPAASSPCFPGSREAGPGEGAVAGG